MNTIVNFEQSYQIKPIEKKLDNNLIEKYDKFEGATAPYDTPPVNFFLHLLKAKL